MTELTAVVESPARPLVVVLGGAKVTDKVGVIDRFLEIADRILIGGAMCFSFFRAEGIATGDSLVEEEGVKLAAEALKRAEGSDCELELPVDLVLGKSFDAETERRESDGVEVPDGWMGLDVGPRTAASYAEAIAAAGTVLWNGPMGAFELEPFAAATRTVAEAVAGGAGDDRGRRRRLGRRACASSGWPTESTGFRPEEEHPWSYWRERTCPEWRRCAMPETRTPLLAANWKMNKTVAEAAEFVDALLPRIAATQHDVVICPSFLALSEVVERSRGSAVRVAAQNMHEGESGAFTGEVSAPMLVEADVEAVDPRPLRAAPALRRDRRGAGPQGPGGARGGPRADPLRRRDRGGARRRADRRRARGPAAGRPRRRRPDAGWRR